MKRFLGGFVAFCAVLGWSQAYAAGGTPRVVSNTMTADGGTITGVSPKARYVSTTPVVTRGYGQRTYVPQQNVNRQSTSYRRTNRTNYAAQSNGRDNGTKTKTMAYQQQSRTGGNTGATSGAYAYNKGKTGYIGMNLDLNLLNWSNKYKAYPEEAVYNAAFDHDDYRFKMLIGGHIVAGYRFNPGWRMDIEGGFTSEFEDSDNGISFKLSVPYVTADVYHDFKNGLYLGIGGGVAFPTISMEWEHFTSNNSSKTATSPMGAAMLGYTYYLSENLILDVRYRFAGFKGPRLKRGVTGWPPEGTIEETAPLESLETKVGFMMDNSISIGLKYEF